MSAQAQNQAANQQQEQYNRAFLGSVAGMNFDQNQGRTSMLSGLYGQQAGLGQTSAALNTGLAQSQVALDPYQRALGSNMPIATIGPSAGLIGQAYGQTMNYGQDLFNTNTNMQASIYNSYQNNQAALRGAGLYGGAAGAAGNSAMGAGIGMAGGALTGAAIGSIVPGIGTLAGAAVGGALGGAGGGSMFCWVARAAWGADNPRWREFRDSMLAHAPDWFLGAYARHGERLARHVNTPTRRALARLVLSTLQHLWTPSKSKLQPA